MADTLGWIMLALLLASLVVFVFRVWQGRLSAAPLVLLSIPAFFVWALYQGQRPLHVMQINHNLYNVRFSLIMVLPAAIFIGCSAASLKAAIRSLSTRRWMRPVAAVLVATTTLTLISALVSVPATTLQEGKVFASSQTQLADTKAAAVMHEQWDGGFALIQNYGDEIPTFRSRIPLQDIIYEGNNNHNLWQRALSDPVALGVRLIYMRRTPGNPDLVWQSLHDSPHLSDYHVVYQDDDQVVYTWGTPAPNEATAQPSLLAVGDATWFNGPSGTCLTSLAPIGSSITVTSQATRAHVTCEVTGSGPAADDRVVNLESQQFLQLAHLSDGITPVSISTP